MVTRALAALGLVLLVSTAGAAGGVMSDGYWWNGLSNNTRNDVMTGATTAYQTGWRDGLLSGETAALDALSHAALSDGQKASLGQTLRAAMLSTLNARSPSFANKPNATYIDAMNGFFIRHPAVTDMDFAAVFACIQDKPSRTCDAIATALRQAEPQRVTECVFAR